MTPEQRLDALRKQVEQRPNDAFAHYSLAIGYRSAGRNTEAAQEFRALVQSHPDYLPTYLMFGQVLEDLGQRQEAAQIYQQGIDLATRARSSHARDKMGEALQKLGR